eukprot:scaffold735_cov255-Pinguiococcus_pyrenoidosus.AAC.28
MVTAQKVVHAPDDALLDRFLAYSPQEEPLVLQLGGSDPDVVRGAARIASDFGYDEVNLNCGCPSERVAGKGCFGAALMREKDLVADIMQAVQEGMPGLPASVKCRVGVDEMDSYDEFRDFVATIHERAGVEHFVVHARKALLGKKFTPEDNRKIPKLQYDRVLRLMQDMPQLRVTINGGITTFEEIDRFLEAGCSGVMIGRAAIYRPFYWSRVDELVYGRDPPESGELVATPLGQFPERSRGAVLQQYCAYAEEQLADEEIRIRRFLGKPLQNLFAGERSGKRYRKALDENICNPEQSFSQVVWAAAKELPEEVGTSQ